MRVFLPLTLTALADARRTGRLPPGTGYAVTASLRAWCGTEDTEELEYAALTQAARGSLALLAGDPDAPRRRVVAAVELPDAPPAGGDEPGAVTVAAAVPMTEAAAVHVDASDAERDVAAAAGADGDEQRAEDHELLWFAVQEVPALVEGL